MGMYHGPAPGDKLLPRDDVAENLLPHLHRQGRKMKELVYRILESGNPRVYRILSPLDGVYEHFEIPSLAGWIEI